MIKWLNRLTGRKDTPVVAETAAMPGFSASELPDLPAERIFSVWDKLKDDPGARVLRAEWEARWDAF
jgi:hypothetical protein